jgi:hypothetical protein
LLSTVVDPFLRVFLKMKFYEASPLDSPSLQCRVSLTMPCLANDQPLLESLHIKAKEMKAVMCRIHYNSSSCTSIYYMQS